ncbi:hypothetical protein [Microbacterium sp. NPDC057650]|uniref:hypothetical protein n=1 Tax=unclassified Microbacterium TaxID=2609290 RepID=UPI0036727A12
MPDVTLENPAEDDDETGEDAAPSEGGITRRTRRTTLFPAGTLEEALGLAEAIIQAAPAGSIRRLTLLDQLGRSPSSGTTRQWITNSNKYGLTTGNYNAETLALTVLGRKAVDETDTLAARTRARFQAGIDGVEVFKRLYETNLGNRLPLQAVLMDQAKEFGIPDADLTECIETFTVNAKFVGVLRTLSGAERLVTLDALVDDYLPKVDKGGDRGISNPPVRLSATSSSSSAPKSAEGDFEQICFYITPIGSEESDDRKHADLFMGSLVEPALKEFGLQVVRADLIGDAGMITRQIIDYIVHSKLVIADLSFHNPNVFYELALRHAVRKPIVQISRAADRLPFDIGQVRTVVVDTTDIFTLVPQLDSLRAQISAQVRATLAEGAEVENPLSIFAPDFWGHLPRSGRPDGGDS